MEWGVGVTVELGIDRFQGWGRKNTGHVYATAHMLVTPCVMYRQPIIKRLNNHQEVELVKKKGRNVGKNLRICSGSRGIRKWWA